MDPKTLILLGAKLSIFLIVLAIGLKTTPQSATYMFRHPGVLVRSLIPMSLIMPMVAVALVLAFKLDPAVEIALVALSLSPVPPILPERILKAGGREDFTIGLLTAAGVLSIFLIPLSLRLLDWVFPASLRMTFAAVLPIVLATILLPLALGIVIHALAPALAGKASGILDKAGTGLLVLAVLAILLGSFRSLVSLFGDGTLISMAVFSIVGLLVGHLFGQRDSGKQVVLAFCASTRHPAIAISIATANFPGQEKVTAAILLYVVVTAIMSSLYLARQKRAALDPGTTSESGQGEGLKPA